MKRVTANIPDEVYEWLVKTAKEQGDIFPDSLIARILKRAYDRR